MSEYGDLIQSTFSGADPALPQAVGAIDDNPDSAKRAIDLANATGIAPTTIYGDLENFERQHKAASASALIQGNPHLSDFVASNPMVPKLANDDYGTLDSVSSTVSKMALPMRMLRMPEAVGDGLFSGLARGFKEGFGEGGIGAWLSTKDMAEHPLASAVVSTVAAPLEGVLRLGSGAIRGVSEGVLGAAKPIGGEKFAKDLAGMTELEAMGLSGRGHMAAPAETAVQKMQPYIQSGREPIPTVLPEYDVMRTQRNVSDLENLSEATAQAQQSMTRERAPDVFKQFIEQHTDAQIGISGDAVAALYGDKVPHPEDGLLGWAPKIADQLELARQTGDDIHVPLSDWLAKVDPAMMQTLHDDIRVRPGNITVREAQMGAEMEKAKADAVPDGAVAQPGPIPEPVPTMRAGAGLEPMFSVGDRKLALQRMKQDANTRFGEADGFHDFAIADENGNNVGALNISTQKGGKELYVDNITGVNGLGPRDFGPALMRDILRQLKAEFPEAETITGHRVSGARDKAGTFMQPSASPVIKLDNPKGWEAAEAHNDFQRMLEGGQWEAFSPKINAYIKPIAERSVEDRAMVDAVREEFARIAPNKLTPHAADRIKGTGVEGQGGAEVQPNAVYIQYRDIYPIVLYALEGPDPIGTARHEAIHHLRNYGFFKDAEWGTLEQAAKDNGWAEKFAIDNRYPKASESLRLEESIADAYKAWEAGATTTPEIHSIFEKMKAFFTAIKERLGQMLGKEPTWEDIFKKVSVGEIGGREGTGPRLEGAFKGDVGKETIYHGTSKDQPFSKLKEARNGTWFTTNPKEASQYAIENDSMGHKFVDRRFEPVNTAARVIPMEHNFQNTLHLTEWPKEIREAVNYKRAQGIYFDKLRAEGYDSIRMPTKDGHSILVSLDNSKLTPRYAPNKVVGAKFDVPEDAAGGSRVFERANALGMTVEQFKRYEKLIDKRNAEDIAAATKRITEAERRSQTREWKDNRKALRAEVAKDINGRPDVAADLFFSTGELYGQKINRGNRLNFDDLTPEQRASLPKEYISKNGLNPDQAATIFGYGSGDALVAKLSEYTQARESAGMNSREFLGRVIDTETERQMQARYGSLENNIIDSVKDQVAGETQIDILHEETVALGLKSGMEGPFNKADVLGWVRGEFDKTPMAAVSSDRYLATAGRAGKAAEMALLRNDPETAFKEKQRQYYATVLANEARKLEKREAQFDRTAKQFAKREVSSVPQEYTNFIHDILVRIGRPVKRSIQDIETEIAAGEYKTLEDFVHGKETFGLREVPVADFLLDPNYRKPLEKMTVDEFRAMHDSIKTLVANGRDERKIDRAGEKADLAEIKSQMIEQLAGFQERTYDAKGNRWMGIIPPRIAKVLRTYGISHIQVEGLFNRWDRDNPKGVFQQYIMRDLADAANNESVLEKRFARRLLEIDDKADVKKLVDNPLFKVPNTEQLMQLNRGNLRTILLNAGNESNLTKLAKGYGLEVEQVQAWLGQHATKADWDWAQKMGDIFAELKTEADVMYRNLSGVAPASLDLKPIDTAHGQYPGWYYPVIFHPEFEGPSKKLMGKDALEQQGFVRATTPAGYTKGRTGYAGPMALDLDALPSRMKQMIHDIAMRPAVVNASKIIYDKDFRAAVSKHFGHEWRDMLTSYLVDVANSSNYMPKEQKMAANALEFVRQNMISTLVGLNPGTVLKHGPTALVQSLHEVGPVEFLKATKSLFSINERTGESNWQFAMKASDELQRRHRNYVETLGGATDNLIPTSQFMSLRQSVQKFSSMPVAISDLLSAVPTWLAQYEKSMDANGGIHGDAVFDANRAVRRAHGSTAITNRSAVMRGGALSQWFASVYGFFNHIMNRQYELMWKSGETLGMVKDGNYREAMQKAPELTSMLFAYVLAPALIEEMVTPLASSDNESWGKKAAKGISFTLGASWVGIRDIAAAALNGRDPSMGLLTTAGKAFTDVFRDVRKDKPFSKEHAGKIIRDGSVLMGTLTGLVPAQIGKTAQFGFGVSQGTERPKGPWGWMTGARFGTLKHHPGSFAEWQKHHMGGH